MNFVPVLSSLGLWFETPACSISDIVTGCNADRNLHRLEFHCLPYKSTVVQNTVTLFYHMVSLLILWMLRCLNVC